MSKYTKTKYYNISDIEKFVDEKILNNKTKLLNSLNSINLEELALKNTKNKSIFYFKKNKTNWQNTTKELSYEISSQARKNLGEKPIEKKIYEITPEVELEKKVYKSKPKISLRIHRKNKDDENLDKIKKTDNRLSKEIDTVISEIEKTIAFTTNNEDEKINNKKEEKSSDSVISKIAEKNINNLVKKNHFIFKHNKKNDLDLITKNKSDYSPNLIENSNFSNKNFKKSNKKETKDIDIPYIKKKFFKKIITNKTSENITNEYLDIKPTIQPLFKDERISNLKDDEKFIIDNGIKKIDTNENEINDFKKIEQKAYIISKGHVEDNNNIEKSNKKNQKNTKITFSEPLGSKHEHVFFDEQEPESDFNGWSPHIIDKERKDLKDVYVESHNKSVGTLNDIELPKEILSNKSEKLSDRGFSENEWEELDFYPLVKPYTYVEILRERETLEKCYFLVEEELSKEEQLALDFIYDTISNMTIDTDDFEVKGENNYLVEKINKVIKDYNLNISKELFNKIVYNLSKFSFGFGKIDSLMSDPDIEDISCDGDGVPLFVYHRKFGSLKSNIKFDSADDLNSFVYRLAQKCGKHISIAEPMIDATMPDGSRIQMTLSDEITTHGSTFTIRKFRSDPFSPPDLIEFNTMSSEIIAYMWIAVENRINMLFSGGTASGKTTCLNALSLFIPAEAKIVSIEETREINLPHPNWIPGVSRTGFGQVLMDKVVGEIDTYDLMKAALRQRPEYIIVGEIRGREAYVLFQAMATGHATYSTVHADSAHSLIHRLEGKPIEIPRVMLQSLDVISIHIITNINGKRARRCKQVIEIIDIDPSTKEILTNEVFRWDPVEDKFIFSGKSYVLEKIRTQKDISRENMAEEIKRRKKIVELMNKLNIRAFRDVARLISRYSESPDQTLNELEKVIKK